MSELSKYLVEQILLEDVNPIKKNIVVYVGRFQPMHKGHFAVYQHLVKKFGKDNVFIGTSNKVQLPKSPFNFKEKELIATKMYGIPKSKFIQVKNPYNPSEVLSKFNPETTSFTTVVSEKDSNRLGGKYFTPYTDEPSQGYKDKGYVYIVPILGKGVSGTEVREKLSSGTEKEKKEFFKNRVFGKFNKPIYDLITSKLNEGIFISKERIEEWMINEASSIVGDGGDVDDGPSFFVPNYDVFSKVSVDRAKKIGYEVINMIMSKDIEDYYEHPRYPNGPVRAVTPFPAGVLGATTANNQIDIYSSDAYSKWFKHATRKASLVGYSLVSDPNIKSDKKQSGDDAKGDLKAQSEYENSINEAITLPVEIGDTLLMGKFKNKKVVVKSIGKDEHGMPTINGKKVVTFRLMKEGFQVIFEDDREDEKYTHVGYGKYKLKGKEDGPTFKKDDSGKYNQLDGDGGSSNDNTPKQNIFKKDSSYNKNLSDKDPAKKQKNLKKGNSIKKIKLGVKKLNHREKQYFGKLVKNQDEVKRSFVQKLKDKTKGAGKAIKDGLKHEVHLFKSASKTIGQLASGKTKFKDLEPEQKKELKSVGTKILVTGAFAASGGVSASAAGIGKLAGVTMAELAPHVVVETILKGIGRAALFADENQEDEVRLNKFAELLIEELQNIEITTEMLGNIVEKHNQSKEDSIDEIAGTSVQCEKCNHSWEIESDDDEKYLCHSCGWDSQQQEYDYDAFDSWIEKMGLNEDSNPNSHPHGSKKLSGSTTVMDMLDIISHKEFGPDYQKLTKLQKKKVHKIALKHKILESYLEELDERGKLRPSEKLRRKAAMAGKGREIARKRARTMKRRKSLDKLKKIAYKMAYRQVYDEFAKELFPDTPKSQLSIQQSKVVHRNVIRKKKRVLKRAKFKFLPDLRAKEVKKFSSKNEHLTNEKNSGKTNEMSKSTLNKIEKFAEKKLSPEDIEFTKHFFDRINDPRNGKEISDAELTGFFKRLSKYKKQFKEFLEKYKQIVVKDKRHNINIPFVKQTNQIIAKTIMRKDDFKTSNPVLSFEQYINEGGAATGGSPIPAEHTMGMYNDVVKVLSSTFKITKNDARPLGSTGKKKAGDFSGDIDIAVDAAKIGSNFKLKFNEVQDFIYNKLKSKFKNVVNMKGLGIISFLYPIPNSDKFGQTDIMLSDNLELTSFMFHSPNFIENESKYKGLYRNDLLFSIVKYLPTNIPDEYFEDGKDKGEIKKFTKHTLSQKKGLITQLKSFEGKLGKTKNAKPIKGADVQITNVPNDIVKYIFGKKYNVDDVKSFEDVYKIIMKSDFKHKKILPKVIKNFKDSILRKKLPLPSEIK